ncbi:hypothetical protein AYM39_11310 [Methylomonas sp. DH-1]|nr:hypothetical protein AYM39_11310 [Methylomonas sp. DH-1]
MAMLRFLKHVFSGPWSVKRAFPQRSLGAIEAAIAASEQSHLGEVRFAVEGALDIGDLLRATTARDRALEIFALNRIWDTEHNSGVLIYLLLADRRVEIVADRGIHGKVGEAGWQRICRDMENQFRRGDFEPGVLGGIAAITEQLQQHFPAGIKANPNEIANAPLLL